MHHFKKIKSIVLKISKKKYETIEWSHYYYY